MSGILDRIDNTIAGDVCPCGASPRPGSAYCSPDCEPTHIARDTDRRQAGDFATPMRWRPDMVTEADHDHLIQVDSYARGNGFTATVYRNDATGQIRYRLDDGFRFVALDLDDEPGMTPAARRDTWAKLERQLTDDRLTEPAGDPWNDVHTDWVSSWCRHVGRRIDDMVLGRAVEDAAAGDTVRVALHTSPPAQPGRVMIGVPDDPGTWRDLGHADDDGITYDEPPLTPREFTQTFAFSSMSAANAALLFGDWEYRQTWLPQADGESIWSPAEMAEAGAGACQPCDLRLPVSGRTCSPLRCDAGEALGSIWDSRDDGDTGPLLDLLVRAQAEASLRERARRLPIRQEFTEAAWLHQMIVSPPVRSGDSFSILRRMTIT